MLSDQPSWISTEPTPSSLNARFGARCFLTYRDQITRALSADGLNAPFGARCFLTRVLLSLPLHQAPGVLMHLLALGAF